MIDTEHLKRTRLSSLELRAITDGLRLLSAKGNAWGLTNAQVLELAALVADADAVIVTPGYEVEMPR